MPENIPAPSAQEITLREYLEGRTAALESHLHDAIRSVEERSLERMKAIQRETTLIQQAAGEAVLKAEQAQQLRNEAMNEWRGTVTDLISRYVEQRAVDVMETSLRGKIEAVEKSIEATGRALEKSLLAVGEANQARAEAYYKSNADRLRQLEEWKSNMQGRMWAIPTIIGVVVFVVTQIMRVMFPDGPK